MTVQPSVLVVAGEPSGDRAAAAVVRAIRSSRALHFFGMGGSALEDAGIERVATIDRAAMGLVDSLRALSDITRRWVRLREAVDRYRPSAALLVDAPELNLPLARILTASGVRVVFYIGPQVWAWRPDRLSLLRKRTDVVALVLPFEKKLYDAAGVRAVFVGHPILDRTRPPESTAQRLKNALRLGPDEQLIAMLPGSRPAEVRRHGPAMRQAAGVLADEGIRAVLAPLPGSAGIDPDDPVMLPAGFSAWEALAVADAALVASGTATLEAAVAGVPMAVIYRTDPLTYLTARCLLGISYVALPNWIEGAPVIPELLQSTVKGDRLAAAARDLLDQGETARQKAALARVRGALGTPGAASRVAELVLERIC